jgi:peptidoglycan hydrolase CwlO-like protein
MNELEEEIQRLRQEIQSLRGEIDEIKGDIAENNNLLKRILHTVSSRN